MEFRTEIKGISGDRSIDYDSSILLLGSCFSQEIGSKLKEFQFNSLSNPYGVIFHPLAIERLLNDTVHKKTYSQSDLTEHDGLWCSLFHHSDFNNEDAELVISNLNSEREKTAEFLKRATHIFITLGTAWAYQWESTGAFVANCHKIPQKRFEKKLLSLEEISSSLSNSIDLIRQLNPSVKIIFTVSPVRHLKDGFRENQISKSLLHLGIESVLDLSDTYYFPAFEIVQDDLRDYRFYANDMVHPSDQAVAYIWSLLYSHWFAPSCDPVLKKVSSINRTLAHRPNHPDSKKHRDLIKRTRSDLEELTSQYPHMTWAK